MFSACNTSLSMPATFERFHLLCKQCKNFDHPEKCSFILIKKFIHFWKFSIIKH